MCAASALVRCASTTESATLIILTLIGDPSDTNWNSYLRPFPSAALQETLDTCWIAKFPICLHVPVDSSTDGVGNPSALGLSLDFNSIRSIDSSYRLSCSRLLLSPENVMM